MANILFETVEYRKGHRNSKGELAEWVIVQHDTGKILSSHKSKPKADKHLQQMEYYKHVKNESFVGYLNKQPLTETVAAAKKLYEAIVAS